MKIFVVDDEHDVRALMAMVLTDAGHDVVELESAAGLVNKVVESRPDVIVLDITMPHIDGFEALQSLKANPDTRQVPVLLASARGQKEVMLKARDLGATDFMVKPWDEGELEWRVSECAKSGGIQAA